MNCRRRAIIVCWQNRVDMPPVEGSDTALDPELLYLATLFGVFCRPETHFGIRHFLADSQLEWLVVMTGHFPRRLRGPNVSRICSIPIHV